jgi:hypothetical protein
MIQVVIPMATTLINGNIRHDTTTEESLATVTLVSVVQTKFARVIPRAQARSLLLLNKRKRQRIEPNYPFVVSHAHRPAHQWTILNHQKYRCSPDKSSGTRLRRAAQMQQTEKCRQKS